MKALIARVQNLLLSPRTEWDIIDLEAASPRKLALGYVAPLAAIPAFAIIISLSVLGVEVGGRLYRAPILGVALSALLFFVLAIAGVYVFAAVIDWLAQRFGAQRNYTQAFKVSAYSITAAMVAGLLAVAPALGVLALLGATYSLYLLFVGAPKVMHVADRSAVNFSIISTFAAILLALGVGLATMAMASPGGNPFPQLVALADLAPEPSGNPAPPGAALDVGPAPLPATAGALADGAPGAVTGGDLRGTAPMRLAGLDRVAVSAELQGVKGARTIEVEAEYRRGDRYVILQLVLSPTIAKTIGFGGPATLEYDRETAEGYSRRRRVGEAIVAEDWNITSRSGTYGRLVEDRFYVKASGGGGVNPQELRQAVELFGRATLAQLEAES